MPNAEYGTTIRMYHPEKKCWEVYYTCIGEYTKLTARKEDESIVITESSEGKMKWIFTEITEDAFHWQNIMQNEQGEWDVICDCRASRKK